MHDELSESATSYAPDASNSLGHSKRAKLGRICISCTNAAQGGERVRACPMHRAQSRGHSPTSRGWLGTSWPEHSRITVDSGTAPTGAGSCFIDVVAVVSFCVSGAGASTVTQPVSGVAGLTGLLASVRRRVGRVVARVVARVDSGAGSRGFRGRPRFLGCGFEQSSAPPRAMQRKHCARQVRKLETTLFPRCSYRYAAITLALAQPARQTNCQVDDRLVFVRHGAAQKVRQGPARTKPAANRTRRAPVEPGGQKTKKAKRTPDELRRPRTSRETRAVAPRR